MSAPIAEAITGAMRRLALLYYLYCLRLAAWYEEIIIPAVANLKIFQVASNSLNHKKD